MEYKYNGELYKEFTKDEAYEWGMKNYSHWLINLQDQENMPKTPVEKFFRYYTQGIHYSINRILRYGDIETMLFDGKEFSIFTHERLDRKSTHGTGCTLSSAIAAYQAQGKPLPEAVSLAKDYLTGAIEHGLDIGNGHGPTDHFYRLFPERT